MTTTIQPNCTISEHPDPRVRRTRNLLKDAFRELIREKRFSDISVQDITERATVNRATFYAHFPDKQALGVSVVKTDLVEAMLKLFPQKPAFTPENLVTFGTMLFDFVGGIHEGCPEAAADLHGALSMGIQDEVYDITYGWLSHSKAHLKMFPGSTREAVASVISSSLFGAAHRWARSTRGQSAADLCRDIVSVLIRR
jgi:AcrR family transcriptional regulator